MKLYEEHATRIAGDDTPLGSAEAKALAGEIPRWILNGRTISREFLFRNFRLAMDFVDRVAAVANEQGHHPDMFISYNTVRLTLTTHKINGLSRNDFIVAAKIDRFADEAAARTAA